MKVAIYARVSTERQAERGTIGSQLTVLRDQVSTAGHELISEFIDDGQSGARLDRPGLDALRDAAEAGLFDAVWCLSPDRLARVYAYQVLVLDELARFGVKVHFTDAPDFATGDPQATLLTQVQGVIAEYEKAKIAERYRRGKLFRARAGEITTWKTAYGYRRVARSAATGPAHLEIYEPEAAVVRRVFTDRAAGTTVREICRSLNADRVPSPTGKATWPHSTLSRLLRNEAYVGRVYFNRTESVPDRRPARRTRQVSRDRADWIPIDCPRIVTDDVFEAAARVAVDNTQWSPRRAEPGQWLLKGLVKCGVCGVGTNCHKMRGRNGTWHRYYYCRNHDPLRAGGQEHRCPERNIRADALDEFVFDQIKQALLQPELLLTGEHSVALTAPIPDDELLAAELARLDRKIDAADAEKRRLVDLYQAGLIELADLQRRAADVAARHRQLQAKRTSLAEQRAALARGNQVHRRVHDFAERIRGVINDLDAVQKQQLLRLLIEEVRVTGWHVEIRLRIALDEPPPDPRQPDRPPDPNEPPAQPHRLSSEDGLRSVGDDDVAVVEEPVEHADGGGVFGQEPSPGFERPVGADAEAAAFVGGGDEPEQQLGGGVVQRGEAELVADDQVVAEQGVDDFADAVVGQAAVEGVDEVGGGEVADPVAGVDRGRAEREQQVAICRCRRGRSGTRSPRPGPIPGRRGSRTSPAAPRRRSGRIVEGLGDREPGLAAAGGGVGGVPGGDLGLDQGAQELLRAPPLRLRGDQQLGCESAHRGHLQPFQPVVQVGGQRRRAGAVTTASPPRC